MPLALTGCTQTARPSVPATGGGGGALEISEAQFQSQVLESEVPVLVDLWGPGCSACENVAPTIDKLAEQYAGRAKVVRVNVAESRTLGARYGIRFIPTLIVFKNGQEVHRTIGAPPGVEETLSQALDRALGG